MLEEVEPMLSIARVTGLLAGVRNTGGDTMAKA